VSAVHLQQFPSTVIRTIIAKKSSFLRTPAFIFCLPWGRPCGNHAKRSINEKTIQCLPNPSQHVPIYLQQFPSYSNRKCKNCRFHVPQPTFLFSLETPLRLSRNMLHEWKDNLVLAKSLAACTHLFSTVSQLFEPQVQKSPFSRTAAHIFVSSGDAPATIMQYVAWMEKQFNACQTPRSMYLSIFNSFRVICK